MALYLCAIQTFLLSNAKGVTLTGIKMEQNFFCSIFVRIIPSALINPVSYLRGRVLPLRLAENRGCGNSIDNPFCCDKGQYGACFVSVTCMKSPYIRNGYMECSPLSHYFFVLPICSMIRKFVSLWRKVCLSLYQLSQQSICTTT